jgi:hypothetical protein
MSLHERKRTECANDGLISAFAQSLDQQLHHFHEYSVSGVANSRLSHQSIRQKCGPIATKYGMIAAS